MSKICKIVHINDGSATVLENSNFHFVEEYDWTSEYVNRLMSEGWEVKHMVPEVSPAIQGEEGSYNFYKSGWTFFLERDVTTDEDPGVDNLLAEEVVDFDLLDEVLDEMLSELCDEEM